MVQRAGSVKYAIRLRRIAVHRVAIQRLVYEYRDRLS